MKFYSELTKKLYETEEECAKAEEEMKIQNEKERIEKDRLEKEKADARKKMNDAYDLMKKYEKEYIELAKKYREKYTVKTDSLEDFFKIWF